MKKYNKALFALGLTATVAATTALGQTNIITVDEFGLGTFNGNPLPSGIATEPFSGMATLTYTLPIAGVRGDIVLMEPPVASGVVSDVIRFDGTFHLYFFSDFTPGSITDPPDSPADVGLPPNPLPPVLTFAETGPESGPNGLFGYVPGPNDPGADPAGTAVSYNLISDIPEPGSLALLVCGLGACGLANWRRKLRRA